MFVDISTYDGVLILLSVVDDSPGHGHVAAKHLLHLLVSLCEVPGDFRDQPEEGFNWRNYDNIDLTDRVSAS